MRSETIYDVAGIGIGPFNLGLAALSDPIPDLKTIFIDQKTMFDWHGGMMIPGTTLQVSYLADLVTMADPSSKFSYLNFLRKQNRLLQFGIYEKSNITRSEYNRYCSWVCNQLHNLRFSSCVKSIDYNGTYDVFVITVQKIGSKDTYTILAKHIVIGIGSIPFIPNNIHQDDYDNIIHSSAYTYFKNKIVKSKEICLVGSGQSAAEIFLDLLNAVDLSATKVNWMTKADRFYAMENTKLNYEMTSPEYIDFFYRLDPETKEHLLHQQSSLYKGINNELINAIYDKLYDLLIEGKSYEISIHTHSELRRLFKKTTTACELLFYHNAIKKDFNISSDYVILATGHRYITPHFLKPLKKFIRLDKNDRYVLSRHYSIDAHNRIFVQNAEIHSHGFNAPDLGLGAYRNAVIINTILKADIYPIDNKTSFQSFGIAK